MTESNLGTVTHFLFFGISDSPHIQWANCISLGCIVMLFAWIAHSKVSSDSLINYISADSCRAPMAAD